MVHSNNLENAVNLLTHGARLEQANSIVLTSEPQRCWIHLLSSKPGKAELGSAIDAGREGQRTPHRCMVFCCAILGCVLSGAVSRGRDGLFTNRLW